VPGCQKLQTTAWYRMLYSCTRMATGLTLSQPDENRNESNDSNFYPRVGARRYASAGLCESNVFVCPSVCVSHAGIVSK